MTNEQGECVTSEPTPSYVPLVVVQALDDTSLPAAARLLMWELRTRLDIFEYREQKQESLACSTRYKPVTIGEMLAVLVERGYIDVRQGTGRTRAYRLFASRRTTRVVGIAA